MPGSEARNSNGTEEARGVVGRHKKHQRASLSQREATEPQLHLARFLSVEFAPAQQRQDDCSARRVGGSLQLRLGLRRFAHREQAANIFLRRWLPVHESSRQVHLIRRSFQRIVLSNTFKSGRNAPGLRPQAPGGRLIGVAWCLGIMAWSLLFALGPERAPVGSLI